MSMAWQAPAEDAPDMFERELRVANDGVVREVVVEAFRLYPNRAKSQSWSPMETAQLIGVLKYLAGKASVPVVEQGADVQKPMAAQLEARGIELIQAGPHAKSAQLHLWHRLLKEGYVR